MFTVTIAVDLAKHAFEIAVAARSGRIQDRKRLSRPQFEQFWAMRAPCRVVMEACASAHYWARNLIARGFEVVLPPQYVKPYRRRNKTERAAVGLLARSHTARALVRRASPPGPYQQAR